MMCCPRRSAAGISECFGLEGTRKVELFDIFLLIVGCLVAVTTLAKMMIARRDKLVAEVREQLAEAAKRKKKEQERAKKKMRAA